MKYQTPEDALKDIFGYDNFRDKQKEIIQANLDGRDGLVIMATGVVNLFAFRFLQSCVRERRL